MIRFTATIKKFDSQGEKTGWTYIDVPAALTNQLIPGQKKSFRVKGRLDAVPYELLALVPMGGGDFILALKSDLRKQIKKQKGDTIKVQMEVDPGEIKMPADLLECLQDEPASLAYFKSLAPSHQKYFANWINDAKTETTRQKRVVASVLALEKRWDFGQMIRAQKELRLK